MAKIRRVHGISKFVPPRPGRVGKRAMVCLGEVSYSLFKRYYTTDIASLLLACCVP